MNNPDFKLSLEIELKYFLPDEESQFLGILDEFAEQKTLTQYFFSLELTQKEIIKTLKQQDNWKEIREQIDTDKLKSRVREISSSKGQKYVLGFKGAKDATLKKQGVIAKPELETEISTSDFKELKNKCDAGFLSKTRYVLAAKISGYHENLILECDYLKSVNNFLLKPKYFVSEIEIPANNTKEILNAIRNNLLKISIGKEELSLADIGAIEVEIKSKADYSILVSNRKIAKNIFPESGIPENLKKFFV